MEKYFSVSQIAEILSVKPITIRRWIQKNKLSAILLDKEYRVSEKDLELFLSARKVKK